MWREGSRGINQTSKCKGSHSRPRGQHVQKPGNERNWSILELQILETSLSREEKLSGSEKSCGCRYVCPSASWEQDTSAPPLPPAHICDILNGDYFLPLGEHLGQCSVNFRRPQHIHLEKTFPWLDWLPESNEIVGIKTLTYSSIPLSQNTWFITHTCHLGLCEPGKVTSVSSFTKRVWWWRRFDKIIYYHSIYELRHVASMKWFISSN